MQHLNQSRIVIEVPDLAPSNKKSSIRVLHVDDDLSILEISKQILMDMGNFEIDSACCVDEAFKKLSTKQYDVIISDYEMPQKDGLQFLKELREQKNDIPFMLFTGKGREEVAIKALNPGADGYYNKQGNPETVYGELCHFLRSAVEKKVVKESLRKNEETLKAIILNAPIGIAWSDSNKLFLGANEDFCRILGFSEEELRKLTFKDITHPDDVNDSTSRMGELVSGRISFFRQEKRYIRKDETVIYGKVTVSAIRNKEGELTLFTAELEDITERVKAEEVLRESEESFRSLIDSMDDLVFVLGFDGIFKNYHQSSHKKELFVPPEEFIGKHFLDVLPPQVAELCQAAMKRIEDFGETQEFDYYMEMNGEKSWYNARLSPTKDQPGQKTSATIVVRNITERKKAEEMLVASETKFRLYVENSPVAVFVADSEGKYEYVNEAAYMLLGYSREELLQMSIAQVAFSGNLKDFAQVKNSGRSVGENVLRSKAGLPVYVILNSVKLPDGKLMAFCENITERKMSEDALRNRESILQRIFDVLPVGLWFADKDGKLLRGNPVGVKIWGAEPKVGPSEYGVFKARRLPSGEEVAPNDWALAHAIKDKVTIVDELLEIDAFDGKKKTILNYTAPVLDAKGDIQGAIVVNQDITERKQAEEALRESEERFRTIFEGASDGILAADVD
jgi:PAS domain S-box-containing protein